MADSYVDYTGDGTTDDFAVPFTFISRSHVIVYLDEVATTAFTWPSDGQITFDTAPANGVAIRIRRETPRESPLVTFTDGPIRRAEHLNNNAKQAVYIAQEAFDTAAEAEVIASGASDEADAAAASAAAAAISLAAALVAETNAETAETNAETAETNAEAAQAAAETARNAALTAETNAELAETNAEAAQAAAEAARDLALTYRNAAQTAETNAELAETNAELAETNAETAEANAEAAQAAAEAARDLALIYRDAAGAYTTAAGVYADAAAASAAAAAADAASVDVHLDQTNIFTKAQTVSPDTVTPGWVIKQTDAGATGAQIELYHDSASPAANDANYIYSYAKDSGGNKTLYAMQYFWIVDPTNGSEDSGWALVNMVAGAQTNQLLIADGVRVGSAAAFPGTGYINALGYWVNGTSLFDVSGIEWSNTHRWASAAVSFEAIRLVSTDGGAAAGPFLTFQRDSASPAVSDVGGAVRWWFDDSGGTPFSAAQIEALASSVTDGAEAATLRFYTSNAGSFGIRMNINGGVYHPSATGTDKGNNTINFGAVYDDNTLLTCAAMRRSFIEQGPEYVLSDDFLVEWDSKAPDTVTPAETKVVPVMETYEETERRIERDTDGSFVTRERVVTKERPVLELVPVYDVDGKTGIDAIETAITETVVIPEQRAPRQHHAARVFRKMVEEGFDPRDPRSYIARLEADQQLPGMPPEAQWEHNSLSVGELKSRLWLSVEFLALAFRTLVHEHDALVARVATLESRRP